MSTIFEDFEDATLAVTINSGDWETGASEVGGYGGTDAYRSKTGLANEETSEVHIAVPSGATICSFWYRVSSEVDYDFFNAYLDDSTHIITDQSGEVDWTHVIVDCTGSSTLDLYYAKDLFTSSGYDAAYIDSLIFADGPSPGYLRHELYLDGAWRDITGHVLVQQKTEITRGRTGEETRIGVDTCTFTIINTGDYSPRNPDGTWYGYLGRNTPHRCSAFGHPMFHGEISDWPVRWAKSGTFSVVPVTSSSVIRRLTQGKRQTKSVYRRGVVGQNSVFASDVVAYWPLEDQSGSIVMSSALSRNRGMTVYGSPSLAANTNFACSKGIPSLTTGSAFAGPISGYADTGEVQVKLLVSIPATLSVTGRLWSMRTTGSAAQWDLRMETDGDITVLAYDVHGSNLLSNRADLNLLGGDYLVELKLEASGSDVDWGLNVLAPQASGSVGVSGTLSSYLAGRPTWIAISPGSTLDDVGVGHMLILKAVDAVPNANYQLVDAYGGFLTTDGELIYESAGARLDRVCGEEGIAVDRGSSADAYETRMGPQTPGTVVDIIQSCERADAGILVGDRAALGLRYASRYLMTSQSAALTLDYAAADLDDFQPIDDDSEVTNRITVTRERGTSVTVELSSGPLSTQAPPSGIGVYDSDITISLQQFVSVLADQAEWRLARATVDAPRFAALPFSAHRSEFSAADIVDSILPLDIGDLVILTNPPTGYPPDDLRQLVIGRRDSMDGFTWTTTLVTVPEGVYRAAVIGTNFIDSSGTTINSALDGTATKWPLLTASGESWTHADGNYDLVAAGERVTVTAISDNLLVNYTFDTDTTDYYAINGTLTHETTVTHSGAGSAKLTTGSGSSPKIESGSTYTLACTEGDVLTGTAWVRADTARTLLLQANWYDSGGSYLSTSTFDSSALSADTWTQLSGTATAPASTAKASIASVENGTPGAGLIHYLDDADVAITGHQLATVTRSVNGVAKSHTSGEDVTFFTPTYVGLPSN